MSAGFENRYSRLDRALHRIAFATVTSQLGLADLEDRMFAKDLAGIEIRRPVFVTALPRAGTTLLLEIAAGVDEFASHTYRDMPFVLIPLLWNRFSSGFKKSAVLRERAHGDGMLVGHDSAEAFEEMVWKAFWPKHYARDRIVPWRDEWDADFAEFLRRHAQKIVALRCGADGTARYLSKNNLNIARIDLVRRCFADAIVIVPFREPLQHAASLLRQHLNFLDIHAHDRFARDYMAAIGHFDFGANLKPIDFDGWLDAAPARDAAKLDFWLRYWIAGYRHLSAKADDRVRLVSYEAFCAEPARGLERLADALEVADRAAFLSRGKDIALAKPHPIDEAGLVRGLADEARALHLELCARSAV